MATAPKAVKTLGVIGSRDKRGKIYKNQHYIDEVFDRYMQMSGLSATTVEIITGGGKGSESLVLSWIARQGIVCRKNPPNIEQFGIHDAFVVRNNLIISECDELIVLWDGFTEFVAQSIQTATIYGKRTTIIPLL